MKLRTIDLTKICLIGIVVMLALALFVGFIPQKTFAYAQEESEIYYADSSSFTTATETVYFSTASDTENRVNNSFPEYYNTNISLTDSCANVAGSMILGYYDRYYDIIPDFTPGLIRRGVYSYYAMTSGAQNVIDALYISMNTNMAGTGTTQAQYKNGLTSYVNGQGYNISFSSVMSGATLDYSAVIAAIAAGKPVSLFLSGFNICTLTMTDTSCTINQKLFQSNHIMIAYGYRTVTYYDAGGNVTGSDTYLRVSTGTNLQLSGYYRIGANGNLNDAESAYIY